jgi:hypothetical protein
MMRDDLRVLEEGLDVRPCERGRGSLLPEDLDGHEHAEADRERQRNAGRAHAHLRVDRF